MILGLVAFTNRGTYLPAPVWGAAAWILAACVFARRSSASGPGAATRAAGRRRPGSACPSSGSRSRSSSCSAARRLPRWPAPLDLHLPSATRLQLPGRHARPQLAGGALARALASTPAPSSPRSCAPASSPCRAARPRPPSRWACGRGRTMRLVILPQALRVIMPPLISQYLNLIKNSSLALAVGYPGRQGDAGRHHHEPDRAASWRASCSSALLPRASACSISVVINVYNARIALRER